MMINANHFPQELPEPSGLTRRQLLLAAGGGFLAISFGGVLAGCGDGGPSQNSASADAEANKPHERDLTDPATKLRAERIISTFENSTTGIQYGYAENLGDGRGITAGRAGFTSGTSDLLLVVKRYAKNTSQRDNSLVRFLPALQAVDGSESTHGLDGFVRAWKETSRSDPALNKAQDYVYDELYFNPAMIRSRDAGINTAIGQLIILDTIIQHGEGDDPDGLPAIMSQAAKAFGTINGNETEWLGHFLAIRRQHLEHAAAASTREGWRESVSRVDALRSLLKSGNLSLQPPLAWRVYGDSFRLDS